MPAPNEDIGGSPPNLTLPLSSSSGGSTGPLLRSHTVPQLRELAQSLAQDRDARRAELQLMVSHIYTWWLEARCRSIMLILFITSLYFYRLAQNIMTSSSRQTRSQA
jgi:hypothetical protein